MNDHVLFYSCLLTDQCSAAAFHRTWAHCCILLNFHPLISPFRKKLKASLPKMDMWYLYEMWLTSQDIIIYSIWACLQKQHLHCDTRCLRNEVFESLSSCRNEAVSKQPSPRHPHELVWVCLRLGAGAGEVWGHELESQLSQWPLRDVLQVNSHYWWNSSLNVIYWDTWIFLNILSSLECYLPTKNIICCARLYLTSDSFFQ